MKKLLLIGFISLASTAALAQNDSLYSEGNYSFLNGEGNSVARTIAPSNPVALNNLYQEGNFPAIDHSSSTDDAVVDSTLPDNLYQEGNYAV